MKARMITKCRELFQCNPELCTDVCLNEYIIFFKEINAHQSRNVCCLFQM